MNNARRYAVPSTPYFVTTATVDRRPVLASPRLAHIVVDNLAFYRDRGDFELIAYVVMPDHIHLLATPLRDPISDVMRNLKSHIARGIRLARGTTGPVWQQSFHDRVARSEDDVRKFAEYIHHNPVVAGMVTEPEDYPFSSASVRWPASSGQG